MEHNWEITAQNYPRQGVIGNVYKEDSAEIAKSLMTSRERIANSIYFYLSLNKNMTGIDLGSGMGHIAKHISPKVKRLYCADISSSYLEYARAICVDEENVFFQKIEPHQLDFAANSSIDFVYAHAVFIHFSIFDIHLYLNEISRILRPGGVLYFTFLELRKSKSDYWISRIAEASKFQKGLFHTLPTQMQFHDYHSIAKLIQRSGLSILFKWHGPNCTVELVVTKSGNSFWRKAKLWRSILLRKFGEWVH